MGDSYPHPSSKQRGRGEGGVNLPTALLIAHMPGHQEPAVTVETISAPPSPSLHGVGLRQGRSTPHPSFFVTFLSPFVSLFHPPLFPLSVLPASPLPPSFSFSLLPSSFSLYFLDTPSSTHIPASSLCSPLWVFLSLFPIIHTTCLFLLFLPFTAPHYSVHTCMCACVPWCV